jgi:hypothetical protein
MLKIRPFQPTEADYEALVTVNNANWPDSPKTGDEEKRADAARTPISSNGCWANSQAKSSPPASAAKHSG